MVFQRGMVFIGLCIWSAVQLQAGVIFQDDFSNPGSSYLNWVSTNPAFNFIEFIDGACKVSDTSTIYSSHVYHQLAAKPSVFTFTCTVKRADASVQTGVAVCYTTSGNYAVLLGDKLIYALKPGETSTIGISCPNLDAQTNKISISKSATDTFNIFVNDRFITSFKGENVVPGDIAFVSYPKTSVVFDDVVLTDEYITGTKATCYADEFDKPDLAYWNKIIKKGTSEVENGRLHVLTENHDSAYCYMLTDLALENFVIRVEVSHLNGSVQSIYGIRMNGKEPTDHASFVINGNRMFGSAFNTGVTMQTNSKIKGAAMTTADGKKYYFIDTLEVVKKKNSDNYFFVVNKDTIDTVTGINFKITEVGFFCQDSIDLAFDNFAAAEGESAYCPISIAIPRFRSRKPYSISRKAYTGSYDILGRNIRLLQSDRLTHTIQGASGIYITGDVRKKIIMYK